MEWASFRRTIFMGPLIIRWLVIGHYVVAYMIKTSYLWWKSPANCHQVFLCRCSVLWYTTYHPQSIPAENLCQVQEDSWKRSKTGWLLSCCFRTLDYFQFISEKAHVEQKFSINACIKSNTISSLYKQWKFGTFLTVILTWHSTSCQVWVRNILDTSEIDNYFNLCDEW